MKRMIAIVLAAVLTLLSCAATAEQAAETPALDHLNVGNPTPMRGEFFTEMWGNATSDIDVRDLLHGYNLVRWDGENGMFTVDSSVVSGVMVKKHREGDHEYLIALYDDLKYSDGTPITAWDYAFSFLLTMAPEISEIGGTPLRREHIQGYSAYITGKIRYLAGVKVLGDTLLSVTLNYQYLPFFYEMGLLRCNPYPISVIAPGVVVKDDGKGVYLANADPSVSEPVFTADLLRKTILDENTGYMSHPSVVSGPYTLTSWDGVTAEFAVNPYYKGNAEGQKPSISTLTYTLADNETMIQQLENGEFDLLDKVMRADRITAGLDLTRDEAGNTAMSNYPRVGLSYISFACEKPTVSSQAVRQAIAWCMNRDTVTEDYTGQFGLRVDGYYGIGQWMYSLMMGTVDPPLTPPEDENDREAQALYEEQLAAFAELSLDSLTQYTLDTDKAAALLDADGWTLNADGLREKDGVVLDLKMTYPEGNNMYLSFETNLVPNLAAVGIRLTMEAIPMGELLTRWYKQGEREEDMTYLASNFYLLFDPAANFLPGEEGKHNWGYNNLDDEQLYEAAVAMRATEPGDVLTYMQRWLAFQQRFNETLPMIPIYSNIYFDFYTAYLKNFPIAAKETWGLAIVGAYLSDEPEEVPAEEEAGEEDGMETFDD